MRDCNILVSLSLQRFMGGGSPLPSTRRLVSTLLRFIIFEQTKMKEIAT